MYVKKKFLLSDDDFINSEISLYSNIAKFTSDINM